MSKNLSTRFMNDPYPTVTKPFDRIKCIVLVNIGSYLAPDIFNKLSEQLLQNYGNAAFYPIFLFIQ